MDSHTDPPTEELDRRSDPTQHPRRVGPYRILRLIGEGGMGVVYQAEQLEPVRRQVAIKMLKPGLDTSEIVARFESERQALAVMSHPNIAKVLDAGTTEEGRPYFVMEYFPGVAITDHCNSRGMNTRQRLELYISVCQAVQHAHQKGVIHRDLKPSNVLVTDTDGQPMAKVIDFGIAKAVERRLTDKTLMTALGTIVGTPAYMSPEQAEMSGLDVDTRTDIYSLGVMLYELLTGTLPVDPSEVGLHAFIIQLLTRSTDPPTPSSRLGGTGSQTPEIARQRATDSRALRRQLKGDLDWIVMKAMDKDRNRRYETANGLVADLRRYLVDEPVVARPPSPGYRLQKFVQRHTAGVVFAGVITVLLVVLATTMTIQARMIAKERDRARNEAAKAEAINDFMRHTLLAPDPVEGLGREVTVAEALADAAARIDDAFAGQEELEASTRSAIGWAYFQMGRYDEAEPLLRTALELRRKVLDPQHPDLAESLAQWGRMHKVRSEFEAAEKCFHEALAIHRAAGPDSPEEAAVLVDLGTMIGELGRFDEGRSMLEQALAIQRSEAPDTLQVAEISNQLAVLAWNQGDYEAAETLWRRSLETRRRLLGTVHPLVAESMNNLSVLFDNTDRSDEAEDYSRQALEIMRETLGPEHEEVSAAIANLAILLDTKGEYEEAEQLYREALRIDVKQLGEENPIVGSDLVNLAALLCETGHGPEGLRLHNRAVAIFEATLEPGHWRTGNTHMWKGQCLTKMGRHAEAERELVSGLETLTSALGPDNYRVERARGRLAELYEAWGRPDKAAEYRQ